MAVSNLHHFINHLRDIPGCFKFKDAEYIGVSEYGLNRRDIDYAIKIMRQRGLIKSKGWDRRGQPIICNKKAGTGGVN